MQITSPLFGLRYRLLDGTRPIQRSESSRYNMKTALAYKKHSGDTSQLPLVTTTSRSNGHAMLFSGEDLAGYFAAVAEVKGLSHLAESLIEADVSTHGGKDTVLQGAQQIMGSTSTEQYQRACDQYMADKDAIDLDVTA